MTKEGFEQENRLTGAPKTWRLERPPGAGSREPGANFFQICQWLSTPAASAWLACAFAFGKGAITMEKTTTENHPGSSGSWEDQVDARAQNYIFVGSPVTQFGA